MKVPAMTRKIFSLQRHRKLLCLNFSLCIYLNFGFFLFVERREVVGSLQWRKIAMQVWWQHRNSSSYISHFFSCFFLLLKIRNLKLRYKSESWYPMLCLKETRSMHQESEQKLENQLATLMAFPPKSLSTHIHTISQIHTPVIVSFSLWQLKKSEKKKYSLKGLIALIFNLAFTRAYSGLWDVGRAARQEHWPLVHQKV